MDNGARSFSSFIGVDLGGGKGKNTAVALLTRVDDGVKVVYVGTRAPSGAPFYDDALVEYIDAHRTDALLCVDAPLLPTVCVRCRLPTCLGLSRCEDPVIAWFRERGARAKPDKSRKNVKPVVTPYTQRACEVVLQRDFGILPRETLGQGMGPLTARAHYLCRALEQDFRLNENLIEVYPKATLTALFGATQAKRYKREVSTWATRAQMLEALGHELRFSVWREGCLKNDHCFDAVICAYTGHLWASDNWQLPEEHREIFARDGWIWMPPLRGED